jgi:hypothetical protein
MDRRADYQMLVRDRVRSFRDQIENGCYDALRMRMRRLTAVGSAKKRLRQFAWAEAYEHVLTEWLDRHFPTGCPQDRCAHCGGGELHNSDPLLPFGVGPHVWIHRNCWEPWRAGRRAKAVEALEDRGLTTYSSPAQWRSGLDDETGHQRVAPTAFPYESDRRDSQRLAVFLSKRSKAMAGPESHDNPKLHEFFFVPRDVLSPAFRQRVAGRRIDIVCSVCNTPIGTADQIALILFVDRSAGLICCGCARSPRAELVEQRARDLGGETCVPALETPALIFSHALMGECVIALACGLDHKVAVDWSTDWAAEVLLQTLPASKPDPAFIEEIAREARKVLRRRTGVRQSKKHERKLNNILSSMLMLKAAHSDDLRADSQVCTPRKMARDIVEKMLLGSEEVWTPASSIEAELRKSVDRRFCICRVEKDPPRFQIALHASDGVNIVQITGSDDADIIDRQRELVDGLEAAGAQLFYWGGDASDFEAAAQARLLDAAGYTRQ